MFTCPLQLKVQPIISAVLLSADWWLWIAVQPTTLAAQQGLQTFDTALSLNAQGSNAKLDAPAWQLFTQDTDTTYQNVTIDVAPLSASYGQDAPVGTYTVIGVASKANLIWDDTFQPVRTCLVRPHCPCLTHCWLSWCVV